MVLLVCCWAGIPLWHALTRWDAGLKAKHAGVAIRAVAVPVVVQSAQVAHRLDSLAYAGVAERSGTGKPGFAPGRLGGVSASGSGILQGGTPAGVPSRHTPGSSPEGMRIPSTSPTRPATVWSQSRRGSL